MNPRKRYRQHLGGTQTPEVNNLSLGPSKNATNPHSHYQAQAGD